MVWCEQNRVDYVLGLAKNERLKAEIAPELQQAAAAYAATGQAARVFKEFVYQTRESWSRARRVIGKAEHLEKGANPRFVVTSLLPEAWEARALYEELYCARGEMENRIKEQFMLFSDRTSTALLRSNQVRLYFSSVAYLLMEALRRLGLAGTELARAQCDTLRLKLLKIGAQIRVTVRRFGCRWPKVTLTRDCSRRFMPNFGRCRCGAEKRVVIAVMVEEKISTGGSVPVSARKSLRLSRPNRRFSPTCLIPIRHCPKSPSASTIMPSNQPTNHLVRKAG